MDEFRGYENIKAWQKGIDLVTAVYNLTKKFPKDELYGLSSQMRRCSVSIPSNIAEGYRREGKDYCHFLKFSFASGSELETQITIAKNLNYAKLEEFRIIDSLLNEVMKLLHTMIKNFRTK